jgi:acetyl esterase/lipase
MIPPGPVTQQILPGTALLDYTNPLTRGLVSAVISGVDMVSGAPVELKNSGTTYLVGQGSGAVNYGSAVGTEARIATQQATIGVRNGSTTNYPAASITKGDLSRFKTITDGFTMLAITNLWAGAVGAGIAAVPYNATLTSPYWFGMGGAASGTLAARMVYPVGAGYAEHVSANNLIRVSSTTTDVGPNSGWMCMGVTRSGTTMRWYRDGVQFGADVTATSGNVVWPSTVRPLQLLGCHDAWADANQGVVGPVLIWNRELTAAEIASVSADWTQLTRQRIRIPQDVPVPPGPRMVQLSAASADATGGVNAVVVGGAYRKFTSAYYSGGPSLDLYVPAGAPPTGGWPVVQFAHSGSWYQGARGIGGYGFSSTQLNALIAAGYAVADIDYTLTGYPQALSQWGWTHPVGCWDYKAAGAWLRDTAATTYNLNSSKMIATGYSAGGHLALEAALTVNDSTSRSWPDNADGDRNYYDRSRQTSALKSPWVTTDPTYAAAFMWSAPVAPSLEYGASAGASAAVESLVGHTLGEAVYSTEANLNDYISSSNDGFYGTTTHYPTFPIGFSWTTSDGLLNSTGAIDALYTVMGEVGVARPAVGLITSTGLTRFHVADTHDNALISASISDFIAWANAALNPITGAVTLTAANATAAGAPNTSAAAGTSSVPGTATPSAANADAAGAAAHVGLNARLTAADATAAGATSHVGLNARLTVASATAAGVTAGATNIASSAWDIGAPASWADEGPFGSRVATYVPGNVAISGGTITLTAEVSGSNTIDSGAVNWGFEGTGGTGTPIGLGTVVEFDVKFPTAVGTFGAVWMLPSQDPPLFYPELDIAEQVIKIADSVPEDRTLNMTGYVAMPDQPNGTGYDVAQQTVGMTDPDDGTDFVTYRLELDWHETRIYRNGTLQNTTFAYPKDLTWGLICNFDVYSGYTPGDFPADMIVRNVTVTPDVLTQPPAYLLAAMGRWQNDSNPLPENYGTNSYTYDTWPPFTGTSGKSQILFVYSAGAANGPPAPTVTTSGAETWTQVSTITDSSTAARRLTAYTPSSTPGADTVLTVDWAVAQNFMAYAVVEYDGSYDSIVTGATGSASSITITPGGSSGQSVLTAFGLPRGDADSAPVVVDGSQTQVVHTWGTVSATSDRSSLTVGRRTTANSDVSASYATGAINGWTGMALVIDAGIPGTATPSAANATAAGAASHVGLNARTTAANADAAGATVHVGLNARVAAAAATAAGSTVALGSGARTTAANADAAGATAHVGLNARVAAAAAGAAGAANTTAVGGSNIPGNATPDAANADAGNGTTGVGTGVRLTAAALVAEGAANTTAVGGNGAVPGTATPTAANADAAGATVHVGLNARVTAADATAAGAVNIVATGGSNIPGNATPDAANADAAGAATHVGTGVRLTAATTTAAGAPNTTAVGGDGSTPGIVTTAAANATAEGSPVGVGSGVRLTAASADALGVDPESVIGGIVTNPGFITVVAALAVAAASEARVSRQVAVAAAVATAEGGVPSFDYQYNSRVVGIRRPDWTRTSRRPRRDGDTPRP